MEIKNKKTSLSNLFGGKVGRGCFPKIEFLELRKERWVTVSQYRMKKHLE
jgi:hypothetical protein